MAWFLTHSSHLFPRNGLNAPTSNPPGLCGKTSESSRPRYNCDNQLHRWPHKAGDPVVSALVTPSADRDKRRFGRNISFSSNQRGAMWITKGSRTTTERPHPRRLKGRRINQAPPRSSFRASQFRYLIFPSPPESHQQNVMFLTGAQTSIYSANLPTRILGDSPGER